MRLQLALNVKNLDRAVTFYSKMFATPVHKKRNGYANFEILEPPLKLVLFERPEANEQLNHIGVECLNASEFDKVSYHLGGSGLKSNGVTETSCCHARQAKLWVKEPDELSWEWYHILDDEPAVDKTGGESSQAGCCGQHSDINAASEPEQVCCA